MNIFNDHLDRVDELRQSTRADEKKFIESVLRISSSQRKLYSSNRELAEYQREIAKLKAKNKETKITLMRALVKKDELAIKRSSLRATNERLGNQNENLNSEIDDLLRGDEVDIICERYSLKEQASLMKDIREARAKLLKYGFPLSFFA